MSSRFTHDKARTELPRSKDLRAIGTVEDRRPNHAANGQFTAGNAAATDRGSKQAIAKALGLRTSDATVAIVARDAARVMVVVLRDMPSDAPTVRNLVAMLARHSAIGAYGNVKADEVGLGTDEGRAWLELGLRHFARAERLTVTALDIATKLAKAPGRRSGPASWEASEEDDAPSTSSAAERSSAPTHESASNDADAAEPDVVPANESNEREDG